MTKYLYRAVKVGLLLSFLIAVGGCNLIAAPLAVLGQGQTRKVPAEYAELPGKHLVIWVWADESLLFDYPAIREDVASHARYFIKEHVKNAKIVDIAVVDKFQRSQYEADSMPIVQIGRKFNADVILFIQVSDFVTRPGSAPNLFQGRINAQSALYDCNGILPVENPQRKVWSGKIEVVYPEHPMGMMETTDLRIRSALLQLFGEKLAKKFYETKEPVEGK
ncbi:MAG: hypothetical protein WC975_14460 [Phycisphaerae bacterium]